VRDLANRVDRLDGEVVRRRRERSGLHRALHRAGVDGAEFFVRQARAEAACLIATFIGKEDVDRARESIFSGQDGRAMTDEKQTRAHPFDYVAKRSEPAGSGSAGSFCDPLTATRGHSDLRAP